MVQCNQYHNEVQWWLLVLLCSIYLINGGYMHIVNVALGMHTIGAPLSYTVHTISESGRFKMWDNNPPILLN